MIFIRILINEKIFIEKKNQVDIESRELLNEFRSYLDIKDSLEIAGQIKVDAENFINKIKDDITEPRDLNLPDISYEELLERLKACYNISEINVESRW